jgi:hypothetical protein
LTRIHLDERFVDRRRRRLARAARTCRRLRLRGRFLGGAQLFRIRRRQRQAGLWRPWLGLAPGVSAAGCLAPGLPRRLGLDLGGFLVGDRHEGRCARLLFAARPSVDLAAVAVAAVAVAATTAAAAARLVAFAVDFLAVADRPSSRLHGVLEISWSPCAGRSTVRDLRGRWARQVGLDHVQFF